MFAMHPWLWLLVIAVITWKISSSTAEIRVVCYYTNWSVYRPGTAKFNPQNINPYLCTHLIYAFGGFTKENNFKPFDKYQDIEKGGYAKFTGLKTYNKNLKTMLAVGGWNEGSSRFSPMVANPERRKEFVKNSIKFLRQNHFDGLDLDWEYPSFRDGGKPRDRDNYASLVQELREEYDRESEKTGRPRLLLTMAVPAGIEYINKGYDVPRLMKYLDWMNILSYDYHSAFEPAVNHHSPLFPLEEESEYNYDSDLNINHTINHYLEAGAERNKLVLGIPTYGRSYTLFNADASEIGDPADGPGEMGDATRENGYLAYYEICEKLKSEDWVVEQPNPDAMGPYAYKDNQWVGYDDESIVRKKSEFVAQRQLGGIMFWSIDNDDFRGNCHGKPYPLIEAAKEALMAATGTIDNVIRPEKPKKSRGRTRPTNKKASDDEDEAKPAQNSGGRQNADIASTRKRVRPKTQDKEDNRQVSHKRRQRVEKKDEDSNEEEEEASKKRRLRVQKENNSRRKESKRRNPTTTTTTTTYRPSVLTPSYTTPAPPTTPDPGSDFKCEDEGFFPHPRDCRKYFWCLGSGPSDLGIVAHQFTCPSGLYFNKAADSCDYTQNVLCNKKKAKATSAAATTTTEASLPSSTTTVRPKPKITTATSRTTSTTTTEYQEEYEYEDEEEYADEDESVDSEEDPRVIKELIDLIKKAGGIEELEKQLKLHEDGTVSVTAPGSTTPPAFSKTLYERVLSRAAGRNTEKPSLKAKNSRGPQYDGIKDSDVKRARPQYTAITRQRSSTEKAEDEEVEEEQEEVSQKSKFLRKSTQPEYKTIARSRPTTSTESDLETTTSSRKEDAEKQVVTAQTPEYVTLKRRRPTTQEPIPKYLEIRGRTSSAKYDEEAKLAETTTFASTIDHKSSELSNNEYINTVEQQNITNTLEVPKTNLSLGTQQIEKKEELQNKTENVLSEGEQSSSLRYRSTTISIESSTPASTKVSDPISSRNLLRPRPFEKSTNVTITRGSNRVNAQEHSRKRQDEVGDSNKDLVDEDFPDTEQENVSNETDSPNVSDRISLRNKLKIQTASRQASQFKPRPFSARTIDNSNVATSTLAPSSTNPEFARTESTNQERRATRRRGSTKFETPKLSSSTDDSYYYYDDGSYKSHQERKYRPEEIGDLSSLTAVDIGDRHVNSEHRRRVLPRQRPSTTEEPSANVSIKNIPAVNQNPRTSPLARKELAFSKNAKRVLPLSTTSADEPSSTTQSSKIQKLIRPTFRRPIVNKIIINESTSEPPSLPKPLQRNSPLIGRRRLEINRPNITRDALNNGTGQSEHKELENPVNKHNRKVIRRFRPTPSTSTTTTTTTTTTTAVPPTTTTESQENYIGFDDQTTVSTTTTTEQIVQQNITENQTTTYDNIISILPNTVTQDNDIDYNRTERGSSDNDDDVYRTSEEEEENIKLSETSIREKSEIHINALNDNSDKHRRRVVKRIRNEGKSSQNKNNYFEEEIEDSTEEKESSFASSVTEHSPLIRTRKIIRKLPATEPTTTQQSVTEAAHKGRTRKVIRRLRPTTTELPSTAQPSTIPDSDSSFVVKNIKYKQYGAKRVRPNAKPVSETPQLNQDEQIEQNGNEYPRFNFRRRQNDKTVNETIEDSGEDVVENQKQRPAIRRVLPQRRQNINETEATNLKDEEVQSSLNVHLPRRQKFKIYGNAKNATEISDNGNVPEQEEKPLIHRLVPQHKQKIALFGSKQTNETVDGKKSVVTETNKQKSSIYGVQKRRKFNFRPTNQEVAEDSNTKQNITNLPEKTNDEQTEDEIKNEQTTVQTNATHIAINVTESTEIEETTDGAVLIETIESKNDTETTNTESLTDTQTSEENSSAKIGLTTTTTQTNEENTEMETNTAIMEINSETNEEQNTSESDVKKEEFSTTAASAIVSPEQIESDKAETSTKFYKPKPTRIQKLSTSTEREHRVNLYSRLNGKSRDKFKPDIKPLVEVEVENEKNDTLEISSESDVTSESTSELSSSTSELSSSTSELSSSTSEPSTEMLDALFETTTVISNQEEDDDKEGTTLDAEDITQQTTTEDEMSLTDVPGLTTEEVEIKTSEEVEKSTVKSTTPFYYRQKLSRPPFRLQRTRPVTEATRPSSTTSSAREYTRSSGYSRYSTRKRDKYKSRYEKKTTTEALPEVDIDEPTKEEETATIAVSESEQNVTTESLSPSTTESSSISTESTTVVTTPMTSTTSTPEIETTILEEEITLTSTESDIDSITTEFVTTTDTYNEITSVIQNETILTTTSNATQVISTTSPTTFSTSTDQLSNEDIQQITDSILEKELLALIQRYQEEQEVMQKSSPFDLSNDNVTELNQTQIESVVESIERQIALDAKNNEDLFALDETSSNAPTSEQTPSDEHHNATYSQETTDSVTSIRRGFVPPRHTFTTTTTTTTSAPKEETGFRTTSQRPKYKPRSRPTERTYKQTTKRVTFNNNFDRSTPGRSKFYIRSTTESAKQEEESGITEKTEEEYYDDEEGEDEEYEDDDEEQQENLEEKTQTEKSYSNSFFRQNKPQYVPKRTGYRGSTERPSTTSLRRFGNGANSPATKQLNAPSGLRNVEAKNSRNKLFSKARKANTPYPGVSFSASTTSTTEPITTTTTEQTTTTTQTIPTATTSQYDQDESIGTTEASDQFFTLQHIFSETESSSQGTTETYLDVTDTSADNKLERLIEVNRIVEVSLKEGKLRHNSTLIPTLDRIGAINRLTVIKIVEPINGSSSSEVIYNLTDAGLRLITTNVTVSHGEALINHSVNAIASDLNNLDINATNITINNATNEVVIVASISNDTSSKTENNTVVNLVINGKTENNTLVNIVINGTALEETNLINATEIHQNASNIIQLYGNGELTDYGHHLEAYMPPHTQEEENYAKSQIRIDGKSVVNTFTPKPSAFGTESATISLEALFQPHLKDEQEDESSDELLQTQNANYVNIKILDQDGYSRRLRLNQEQPLLPIRVLKQDEYTTSRAEVIEITPKLNSGMIKIAPIALSLGRMQPVQQFKELTTVVFPISTKGDE